MLSSIEATASLGLCLLGFLTVLPTCVFAHIVLKTHTLAFHGASHRCSVFSVFWSSLFPELRWQSAQAYSVHIWLWARTHTHTLVLCVGMLVGAGGSAVEPQGQIRPHVCLDVTQKNSSLLLFYVCFWYRESQALLFIYTQREVHY